MPPCADRERCFASTIRSYIDRTLDGIVGAGGHVVRLFLFEAAQGIEWNMTGAAPQTTGVSPTFLANLDQVLTEARARGLWVHITAMNAAEAVTDPPAYVTYFKDLYNNTGGETDAYENLVLAPTLAVLDAHRDNIYALDLTNEIESANNGGVFANTWAAPRAFLQQMRAFVKAKSPWLLVTSTAGIGNPTSDVALGFFSGIGLDFYDIHEYTDTGDYTGATDVCNRAQQDNVFAILGEYGQAEKAIDDAVQLASTTEFLANSQRLCFKAAIAWRYDYSALSTDNWFNFVRADGSYRPAVTAVRMY